MGNAMNLAYRQGLLGSVQQVLFEEAEGDYQTGHAPNYVKVYVPGQDLHNQVRPVRITQVYRDGLLGELMEEG